MPCPGLGADAPLVVGQFHAFGLKLFGFTCSRFAPFVRKLSTIE
jgi:hypothetical protein